MGVLLVIMVCSWWRYRAVRLTTEFTNLLGCGTEARLNPELEPQIHIDEQTFPKIDLLLYQTTNKYRQDVQRSSQGTGESSYHTAGRS